jgi:hypothetical protein
MRRLEKPMPIRGIHRVACQRAAEELSALMAKPGLRWRKAPTRQSAIMVFCVAGIA